MNIAQAKREIENTLKIYLDKDSGGCYVIPRERRRPVLLIGAPGIGKTAIMSEVAEELGVGFLGYTMTHHTRQSAIGLPFITQKIYGGKEYSITEYTMSEIVADVYSAIEKQGKKEGILFVDEINCVSETLAPAMLELLQHKKFGAHYIPEGWVLVAAGNPEEFNKSVNELDMVTLDRVKKINVEPDYNAFYKYAVNSGVHPSILAYLKNNQDKIFSAEKTVNGFEFVTPRGWEDLSFALISYEKHNIEVTSSFVGEYIQSPVIAGDFYNYYNLYNKYAEVVGGEEVELGEMTFLDVEKVSFDEKFALSSALSAKLRVISSSAVACQNAFEMLKNEYKLHQKKGEDYITERVKKITQELENSKLNESKKLGYKSIINTFLSKNPSEEYQEKEKWTKGQIESATQKIKNILVFCENTFKSGQHLTFIMTDLISNENFVTFAVGQNIDEFYKLNSLLLLGEDQKLKSAAKNALSKLQGKDL